jgi:hypothetical protein
MIDAIFSSLKPLSEVLCIRFGEKERKERGKI